MTRTIRILRLVADDVAAIFPYFLAFWLISLLVSAFFPAWRDYYNWPAFHASVVMFALISLGSYKVQNFWEGAKDLSKKGRERSFEAVSRAVLLGAVFVPVWKKILLWKRQLGVSGYIKLAVILLVLIFSLFQGIYSVDFFVLLFGLISVLFGLDMRISAGFALVLLVLCPFLLAFNQNGFAETAAVYAYYFLAIAVLTAIGDIWREKVIHRLARPENDKCDIVIKRNKTK
jgi:MFS family permease